MRLFWQLVNLSALSLLVIIVQKGLVLNQLDNTYICSIDNYYPENLFNTYEYRGFYSTIYVENTTNKWVVITDENFLTNNKDKY